jgi:hypothetical protein
MAVKDRLDPRYVEALKRPHSEAFDALRGVVADQVAEGQDREEIYQALRVLRTRLQARGYDGADDVVVDVMDALTGFSSSLVAI